MPCEVLAEWAIAGLAAGCSDWMIPNAIPGPSMRLEGILWHPCELRPQLLLSSILTIVDNSVQDCERALQRLPITLSTTTLKLILFASAAPMTDDPRRRRRNSSAKRAVAGCYTNRAIGLVSSVLITRHRGLDGGAPLIIVQSFIHSFILLLSSYTSL